MPKAANPRRKTQAERNGQHSMAASNQQSSLRRYLEQELANVDKRCVFTCRRINKLGFRSKDFLEQYFSHFGEVKEVFVTHPRSKPLPDGAGGNAKFRPGNFGIVVMKSPEDVQVILAMGVDQLVNGVQVRVQMFEAKTASAGHEDAAGGYGASAACDEHGVFTQADDEAEEQDVVGPPPGPWPHPADMLAGNFEAAAMLAAAGSFGAADLLAAQDPQKVALQPAMPVRVGTEGWASCLRQQAERLRAEADAMLAIAEVTSKMPAQGRGYHAGQQQAPRSAAPQAQQSQQARSVTQKRTRQQDGRADANGTLSSHLMEVSSLDPARVFVARQIHKLGFQSREKLWQHFSEHGKVLRVLVADKRVKAFPGANGQRKTRPGGLGLIVMKSDESVNAILALGSEQNIDGHHVIIEPYEGPKTNNMLIDVDATSSTQTPSSGMESRQSSIESNASHPKVPDVPGF